MSETADRLIDLGSNYLSQIIDAAKAAVPLATNIALQTTSFTCIVSIVTGFVMLVVSSIFGFISYKVALIGVKIHSKWRDKRDYSAYDGFGHIIASMILAGSSVLCLLCSMLHLLSIWSWVGVWHPDIYLVHEAIVRISETRK